MWSTKKKVYSARDFIRMCDRCCQITIFFNSEGPLFESSFSVLNMHGVATKKKVYSARDFSQICGRCCQITLFFNSEGPMFESAFSVLNTRILTETTCSFEAKMILGS